MFRIDSSESSNEELENSGNEVNENDNNNDFDPKDGEGELTDVGNDVGFDEL